MTISRRSILSGALSVGALELGGCASLAPDRPADCTDNPLISNPFSPLTIDVHAHVFNGTDIPVANYIKNVRGRNDQTLADLGGILQLVVWTVAPNGEQELSALQELNGHFLEDCRKTNLAEMPTGRSRVRQIFLQHRAAQHQSGVRELKRAVAKHDGFNKFRQRSSLNSGVREAILGLSENYEVHSKRKYGAGIRARRQYSASNAAVDFALRQFQYRYVNTFDFLELYGKGTQRKIDLALCHFLDFDWPLAQGRRTPTSIQQQVDVMEQISILTGGRVHAYVPYDPMRQVAFSLGHAPENALEIVKSAITKQGCIGVKLYPPVGFAPSGNDRQDPDFWNRGWLPPFLRRPEIGPMIEQALWQLYSWCGANSVPIMAHTSASEGPSDDFEQKFTDPKAWEPLLSAGVPVNFGHFGDTELGIHNTTRAQEYANLMGPTGSPGANFYADSAYFTKELHQPEKVQTVLETLFRQTSAKGNGNLAHRLMYGSDWEMLLIEAGSNPGSYLNAFETTFAALDRASGLGATGKLSDAFFGGNAVEYLGLKAGSWSSTRSRLDSFYASHNVPKPLWATKVDRPPIVHS